MIGRQFKVYRSHSPVVMVLILVPWFYEGKGAIIACQVSSKADQHLSDECRLIHHFEKNCEREIIVEQQGLDAMKSIPFQGVDGRQRRRCD